MKKIIIITGILLLSVALFAQRNHKSETAARRTVTKPKTETTARRNPPQKRNVSATVRTAPNRKAQTAVRSEGPHQRTGSSTQRSVPNRNTEPVVRRTVPDRKNMAVTRHTEQNRAPGPVMASRNEKREIVKGNPATRDAEQRKHYVTPNRRSVRNEHGVNVHRVPVKFKKVNPHYRSPGHMHVIWTPKMYREYRILYPEFRYWYYPAGYTIVTVPAYRAYFHIGEVRNVYGRIHEVWYSWATDEYHLYFGGNYPYQDFTVILPGKNARRYSRFPETFFEGRYLWVTGLVSTFEGKPEILVKRNSQVHLY